MRAHVVSRRPHAAIAGLLITAAFAAVPVTSARASGIAGPVRSPATTSPAALTGTGVLDDIVATSPGAG